MAIPYELRDWAERHNVTDAALRDLADTLGAAATVITEGTGSETRVQGQVRLAARGYDMRLFRNNVGSLPDRRGVPVRFGLCNDTPAVNDQFKSADLIGWKRRLITADMVGSVIAQFASAEVKKEGWRFTGDEHEMAQQRWAAMVAADGGFARFVTSPEQLR